MSDVIKIIVQDPPAIIRVINPNLPSSINVISYNVIERVVTEPPYSKILSGFTDSIDQAEHGLTYVRGLRVCKPTGELVDVAETYSGTTVQIDSNILLDNHILTLY